MPKNNRKKIRTKTRTLYGYNKIVSEYGEKKVPAINIATRYEMVSEKKTRFVRHYNMRKRRTALNALWMHLQYFESKNVANTSHECWLYAFFGCRGTNKKYHPTRRGLIEWIYFRFALSLSEFVLNKERANSVQMCLFSYCMCVCCLFALQHVIYSHVPNKRTKQATISFACRHKI